MTERKSRTILFGLRFQDVSETPIASSLASCKRYMEAFHIEFRREKMHRHNRHSRVHDCNIHVSPASRSRRSVSPNAL